MDFLSRLVSLALWIFEVALVIYIVLLWVKPAQNKWTDLLSRFLEPILTPIRAFLTAHLPAKLQFFDWSPVAAWLLAELAAWMLKRLFAIFA